MRLSPSLPATCQALDAARQALAARAEIPTAPPERLRANVAIADLHRAVLASSADAVASWLRLLSAEYNRPIAELRALMDAHDLADEIAGLLVRHAKRAAMQHVQAGTEPDALPERPALVDRLISRYFAHYRAERDAKDNEIARLRLEALFRSQQIRRPGQAPENMPVEAPERAAALPEG